MKNQQKEKQDESVANFSLALKNLAKDCAFVNIEMGESKIQTILLGKANLTFDSAMKIAEKSMETVNHQTKSIKANPSTKQTNTCWRCKDEHNSESFHFYTLSVSDAGRKDIGHLSALNDQLASNVQSLNQAEEAARPRRINELISRKLNNYPNSLKMSNYITCQVDLIKSLTKPDHPDLSRKCL